MHLYAVYAYTPASSKLHTISSGFILCIAYYIALGPGGGRQPRGLWGRATRRRAWGGTRTVRASTAAMGPGAVRGA